MSQIVSVILNLILFLLPRLTDNKTVTDVINTLVQIVPTILKEAQDVVPLVRQIIELLRSKDLTEEQLLAINVLSAQIDAAYDAAIADYDKENPSDD